MRSTLLALAALTAAAMPAAASTSGSASNAAIMGTITVATAVDHCPPGTVSVKDVVTAVRVYSTMTGTNAREAGAHLEALAQMNRDKMDDEAFARFCRAVERARSF